MSWLFFALLSPALYAVVSFNDKYIIEREVRDYRGMVIFTAITGLVAGTLLWVLAAFPVVSYQDAALLILAGMLAELAAALYFKAMTGEAASNILVLFQMTPIAVLILSAVFLREQLAWEELAGFALILSAAVGVTLKRGEGRFHVSSAFFLILAVDFLTASSIVLFKFVSRSNSFAQIVSYEGWGIALGGLILYLLAPPIRRAFHTNITMMRWQGVVAILANESLYTVAKLLGYMAVWLGSPTLVSVLGSTSVFYGILLGWGLTLLSPATYREDIRRSTLIRKGALASVLLAGIALVN